MIDISRVAAFERARRLLLEHGLEERDRAIVPGLTQPEHRLPAHFGVAMRLRELDQLRHGVVFWQLADREDRALPDLRIRIVAHRLTERRDGALAGLLREPEERLTADARARVVLREIDQRGNPRLPCQRQDERQVFAERVVCVGARQLGDYAGARLAARSAEPERRVAAQPLRTLRLDELPEGHVRGGVAMQRNGRDATLRRVAMAIAVIAIAAVRT